MPEYYPYHRGISKKGQKYNEQVHNSLDPLEYRRIIPMRTCCHRSLVALNSPTTVVHLALWNLYLLKWSLSEVYLKKKQKQKQKKKRTGNHKFKLHTVNQTIGSFKLIAWLRHHKRLTQGWLLVGYRKGIHTGKSLSLKSALCIDHSVQLFDALLINKHSRISSERLDWVRSLRRKMERRIIVLKKNVENHQI